MAPISLRVAVAGASLVICSAAFGREVHWYLASGNTEGNAEFLTKHG